MATNKLKLICGQEPKIEGAGDDLRLTIHGHRKKKTGSYEFYEIDMSVGRWTIQRLARQIATMHARDRERLARETARIEREIAAIQQPETTA